MRYVNQFGRQDFVGYIVTFLEGKHNKNIHNIYQAMGLDIVMN